RIVERDVMRLAEQEGSEKPKAPTSTGVKAPVERTFAPPLASGQKTVVPMSKMRTAIAAALQRSKQLVPHFYETIDIDVEDLLKLRERLNHRLEGENVRLSLADFVAKALATALLRHPALNARFDADKGEITRYGDVNLGIAVAIADGLIV